MAIEVRLDWSGADALPAAYSNQALAQLTANEVYLTFGQAIAPAFAGPPEEQQRQAEALQSVPVMPLSRIVMTPESASQLLQVLGEVLERFARQAAEAQAAMTSALDDA